MIDQPRDPRGRFVRGARKWTRPWDSLTGWIFWAVQPADSPVAERLPGRMPVGHVRAVRDLALMVVGVALLLLVFGPP